MSDAWHYVDGNETVGPVPHEQLRKFLLSPSGGKNTLVWRNGFSDWKAAYEVGELGAVFEEPPPFLRRVTQPAANPMTASPASAPRPVKTSFADESFGKKALRGVGSLFGLLIGFVGFKVLGATLVWPAALIGITWFILAKCKVETVAVPMLAVVVGHTGWMIVGHAMLFVMGLWTDDQLLFLVDVVIVIALLIWFLWARSRAAAIGVLVYQMLALSMGALQWGEVTIPGASSQALMLAQAMHIFLRVMGICLCIYAIAKLRKKPATGKLSEVFE